MTKLVFTETAPIVTPRSIASYNFLLSKQERISVLTEVADGEVIVDDSVFSDYTPADYITEEDIIVTDLTLNNGPKTFESKNESIATVDENGKVTKVSNGSAEIIVRGRELTRNISVNVALVIGENIQAFERFDTGTLGKDVSDAIDARIASKSASTALKVFSTQNHTAGTYIRNTSFWGADIDFTCVSPWNSNGGVNKAGTLISPRHIIFAKHYKIANGATIRFVKADNTVITRTLSSQIDIANDLTIGLLNSDVPAGISFAKILPQDVDDYIVGIANRIPCVRFDQEEKALIGDIYNSFNNEVVYARVPSNSKRVEFYEDVVGGDSGNPCFLIINDEPVLITTWTHGVAGDGDNIKYYKTEINSAMTTLGGGYQLTEVDLTGFTNFNV